MRIKRHILIFKLLFASFLIISCTDASKKASFIENNDFKGLIIVDEINALKSGEKVLKDGGNAVDAAVSMALTLGVSLPSRVSYASSGVCKVTTSSGIDVYDFRKENTFIKALTLMHAENGSQVFSSLASKAEVMANIGIKPDEMFINDIQSASGAFVSNYKNIEKGKPFINSAVHDIITKIRLDPIFGYYNKKEYHKLNVDEKFYNNKPDVYKDNKFVSNALLPPATTEFSVIDRRGVAITCSLSLGELFGGKEIIKGVSLPVFKEEFSPNLKISLKNGFVNSVETSKSDKIVCDKLISCNFEGKTSSYKIRVVK